MSIYLDKLAHVQVGINCQYSIAQMCTREDTLAHNLGALYFDDVMSYNLLTIPCFKICLAWGFSCIVQVCAGPSNPLTV